MRHYPLDMTFTALAKRADETAILDTVHDVLRNDDLREVTAFFMHEQADLGEDCGYRLVAKELMGVALADLDDPAAPIEILDRNQAVDLFGWRYVADLENVDE